MIKEGDLVEVISNIYNEHYFKIGTIAKVLVKREKINGTYYELKCIISLSPDNCGIKYQEISEEDLKLIKSNNKNKYFLIKHEK